MITQVVISAGGKGERLRPLTEKIPKVMLPLAGPPATRAAYPTCPPATPCLQWRAGRRGGREAMRAGKPLLEHHLEHFKKYGVKEFFLTLNYLPEKIMEYFEDGARWGVKISYAVETESLGDMGGLKFFEERLGDNFYFIWGDMYSEVDYGRLAEAFLKIPDAIGMERMALVEYNPEADFVECDGAGRLTGVFPKKSPDPGHDVWRLRGSMVFSKRIFNYFPPAPSFFTKGGHLLPALLAAHEGYYKYECGEYSKGIDTMEKYREVEKYVRKSFLN